MVSGKHSEKPNSGKRRAPAVAPPHILSLESRNMFRQMENGEYHSTYAMEKQAFYYLASGQREPFYRFMAEHSFQIGNTTDDSLQTIRYAAVTFFALAVRVCMDNGLPEIEAYNISDRAIGIIDKIDLQNGEEQQKRLYVLLDHLLDRMHELRCLKTANRNIASAANYIMAHIHEAISRDEVAAAVGVSSAYLSTLFQKELGKTLKEYIRDEKIRVACQLLRYKNASIAQVAYSLGYSSESYFCKIFRAATGATPKQYRKQSGVFA